jgi:hypothetical protein
MVRVFTGDREVDLVVGDVAHADSEGLAGA